MEIIEDRHGKRATIIVSQLPTDVWHQVIGEQTIADAGHTKFEVTDS